MKISEEEVNKIREIYAVGGISLRKLGEAYGVSASNIHYIVHKRKTQAETKRNRLAGAQNYWQLKKERIDAREGEALKPLTYKPMEHLTLPAEPQPEKRRWRNSALSPEQRESIPREYAAGTSIAELAQKYGVHENAIRYWIQRKNYFEKKEAYEQNPPQMGPNGKPRLSFAEAVKRFDEIKTENPGKTDLFVAARIMEGFDVESRRYRKFFMNAASLSASMSAYRYEILRANGVVPHKDQAPVAKGESGRHSIAAINILTQIRTVLELDALDAETKVTVLRAMVK